MWDEEDGFYYDVLRLPDGSRDAAEGAIARRAAAALRDDGRRAVAARARAEDRRRTSRSASAASPELLQGIHPTGEGARATATAASWPSSTSTACAGFSRRCSTSASSSARTAFARCRACHEQHPYVFHVGGTDTAWTTCRPNPTAACSAATRTGAGPIWMPMNVLLIRALLQFYLYLRRLVHRRVSDRLGPPDESVRGGAGDRHAAHPHLPARRARTPPGVRRHGRSSRPIRTGAITCCSTSTSTATTAPASAPATRPAGPGSSRIAHRVLRQDRREARGSSLAEKRSESFSQSITWQA